MNKWDKIFTASLIVFLIGVIVFLLGEHVIPDWWRTTLLVGAALMSLSGIAAGVSGIVLILNTNVPAR